MAWHEIKSNREPVIRALLLLHRETCVGASALLVAGFVYLSLFNNLETVLNMEKKDTDGLKQTLTEIPFWNRLLTRTVLLIAIIAFIVFFVSYFSSRQNCVSQVSYHPVGTVLNNSEGFYSLEKNNYFRGQKFKSRDEAIKFCISNN